MRGAIANTVLALLFAFAAAGSTQEVQFIDLTAEPQRVALRFPLPHAEKSSGKAGAASIDDCAPDLRGPHAARVYFDRVYGKEIDPTQPFQAEFRFVNTGRFEMNVPVSPNLSNLQPADPAVPFSYLSLGLVASVGNNAGPSGYVELYGTVNHKGTTRVLRPGEWIRVKSLLTINPRPAKCSSLTLVPGFDLHCNRFRATSRGFWEDSTDACYNEGSTSPTSVQVMCARAGEASGLWRFF